MQVPQAKLTERRAKRRFSLQCELRYSLLDESADAMEVGRGETINMSSGGVAFELDHQLPLGRTVELSIGWPVLLGETCALRLNVIGRVLRCQASRCVCSLDRYEFRTQARVLHSVGPPRRDPIAPRPAVAMFKEAARPAHA